MLLLSHRPRPASLPDMKRLPLAVALLLVSSAIAPSAEPAPKPTLPPAAKKTIDFDRDVKPILAASCVACHGSDKQRGGLRLDDRDAALKGGNTGPVIKPGSVESRLL